MDRAEGQEDPTRGHPGVGVPIRIACTGVGPRTTLLQDVDQDWETEEEEEDQVIESDCRHLDRDIILRGHLDQDLARPVD